MASPGRFRREYAIAGGFGLGGVVSGGRHGGGGIFSLAARNS